LHVGSSVTQLPCNKEVDWKWPNIYGPEKLMALHLQFTSSTITVLNAYECETFLPLKQLKMVVFLVLIK